MEQLRRLYRRVDQWTKQLSRGEYALVFAIAVFLATLGVGLLVPGDSMVVSAGSVAVGIGIGYYMTHPQQ